MSIYAIYFSPTGGTEKIVTFIAEQFGEYQSFDLCEKTSALTNDFSKKDLCIIGVPSFGGRVPAIALERIKSLNGNNATAILITVYGNRAYEDIVLGVVLNVDEDRFSTAMIRDNHMVMVFEHLRNFGVMVAQIPGRANECLHHTGHLLSGSLYHKMTTCARRMLLLGRAEPQALLHNIDHDRSTTDL